jgi:PKD repeat protein
LPLGVSFARNGDGTATISGIPSKTAEGIYPLRLTARNPAGTVTQAFTLTVTRAPAVSKIPATTATVGVALNLPITTTGYPAPALTESGPLPIGLSFTDNGNGTATIAGTPAHGSKGRHPITVTAASNLGTASWTFTLKVSAAASHHQP